jgi:micrococcal nuclease
VSGRPGLTDPWVKSRWQVGIAIVVAVVAGSCTGASTTSGTASADVGLPLTNLDVVVTTVADGDSFRAEAPSGEIEVRLLGINSPELDECHGRVAKNALVEMIEGRTIGLATERDLDQFDRVLARAVVERAYVNLELVLNGHALALSDDTPDRDLLFDAEEIARAAGVGMWATDACGAVGPPATLEITAIDYDPAGSDEGESVTISNTGDAPVELDGFVLRDESSTNRFAFPPFALRPGGRVVIVSGCDADGDLNLTWCADQPVWNNGGDTALLLDRVGRIVAVQRYWLTSGE